MGGDAKKYQKKTENCSFWCFLCSIFMEHVTWSGVPVTDEEEGKISRGVNIDLFLFICDMAFMWLQELQHAVP